jgi:hypothetical protein
MAYVTYTNRSSSDYRFTCKSLDDPEIANLKSILVKQNDYIKRARKNYGRMSFFGQQPTKGLRIRPRGPRLSQWAKDTPWENATHYDVYIRDYS